MINIVEALDQETAKRIRQSPRNSNRSSDLGWWEECPRYLVLVRTDIESLPLHDIGLQRIFDEGREQERIIRREIEKAGFEITNVQRDEKWGNLNITGHIDGKICLNGITPILEIKSCSPNIFPSIAQIQDAKDLRDSKYSWIRKYYAQMQGYHLLFNEESGVILFKNKSTGEKHQIESRIDYEYCEKMCSVIEEVNARVDRNDPWPAEQKEACRRCGFAKTKCFPGRDYGPGYEFISNEEIESKLIRLEEIKPIAKEYEALDKEIKGCFKGKDAIVGEFIITSKEVERKGYVVNASTYWKVTIERLGGINGDTD